MIDETAATGFGAGAADYQRARPGYPASALDAIVSGLTVPAGARVLDVGAGTGKWTGVLVDAGFDVLAVEPVDAMLAELRAALPGVEAVTGAAEALPVPDASTDLVTVAQSFHWFDAPAALAEFRRALRRDGGVAVLFNERDEREPWVARMSEVVDWWKNGPSRYQRIDWTAVLAGGGFGPVGHTAVAWDQPMDRDLLAARVRSISYVARSDAATQAGYVERVLACVEDLPERFVLPYVTRVWWAKR